MHQRISTMRRQPKPPKKHAHTRHGIMTPPPRKRKKEEEEEHMEEHHFPTAAELGTNKGSHSLQTKCPGFDPRIATIDVVKAGSDALIDMPCNTVTHKGCCKRPDCKSFIKTYTSVDEWNAHLDLHKETPCNRVSINDSAMRLRITMAKRYFAKMAGKFLGNGLLYPAFISRLFAYKPRAVVIFQKIGPLKTSKIILPHS